MKWLENMVLQTKLMLLTGIMVIAMSVLAWMGFNATSNWKGDIEDFGNNNVPGMISLDSVRINIKDIANQQNRIRGLQGNPKLSEKAAEASQIIQSAFDDLIKDLKTYRSIDKSDQEAVAFKKFEEIYPQWLKAAQEYKTTILDEVAKTNDPQELERLFNEMTSSIEKNRLTRNAMNDLLQQMYELRKSDSNNDVVLAQSESGDYKQMFIIMALSSIVFAIVISWLLIRSITRSITQSVTSIRDGAMQITSASDQVASSSSSLAQGASEQASSVEEVSATLEESTAINTQNVDNARQADILAKNANDSARQGYEKGEQLSSSMHAITESAAKISGIIKAIDQIAFQTNLLALNAAVEAARAGEHGLGFAVVADEVRNLAQRAASAAKETSDIIEEVVEQIKEGNEIALATHTAFQDIVDQSKKVSDLIGEISIAGKEQSEGMAQINSAMGQVDEVTQQVAANSEEAAAAAEELNAQATSMMETVRILAKMVGMESDAPVTTSKKKQLHHLDVHAISVQQKKPILKKDAPVSNKAEEIFPLHEDDLKEF